MEALEQGGAIAWAVFLILCAMSVGSFYILFTKLIEQQKIINQSRKVRQTFWRSTSLKEGSAKLDKNSAYKQPVDDGIARSEEHTSEIQSLMRTSYALLYLQKTKQTET